MFKYTIFGENIQDVGRIIFDKIYLISQSDGCLKVFCDIRRSLVISSWDIVRQERWQIVAKITFFAKKSGKMHRK